MSVCSAEYIRTERGHQRVTTKDYDEHEVCVYVCVCVCV